MTISTIYLVIPKMVNNWNRNLQFFFYLSNIPKNDISPRGGWIILHSLQKNFSLPIFLLQFQQDLSEFEITHKCLLKINSVTKNLDEFDIPFLVVQLEVVWDVFEKLQQGRCVLISDKHLLAIFNLGLGIPKQAIFVGQLPFICILTKWQHRTKPWPFINIARALKTACVFIFGLYFVEKTILWLLRPFCLAFETSLPFRLSWIVTGSLEFCYTAKHIKSFLEKLEFLFLFKETNVQINH